jgi:diguanylate cyclase (GGDEF)-like protein/PAS domain S-box-containing protein
MNIEQPDQLQEFSVTLHDSDENHLVDIQIKDLFDALPVATFVKDKNSKFLLMNKACEQQWGISFDDIRGTDASQFFPADLMKRFLAKDQEVFQGGKQIDFVETFWNAKLQENRIGHTFKKPVYDAEGNPIYLIGSTIDISEQSQAEQDLRISEEKLRGLYELSPLGIALTDMKGRYVEFNEAFRHICGYTETELRHIDYWALTPREYEVEDARQLETLVQTGRYGPYEKAYHKKNGDLLPVRLNGMLVTGKDGQQFIWSIVEDISSRKQHEEQLERIAHYDALTGIPNRVLLADRMKQAMAQTVRDQNMLAVCYLDLDGFKPINDQFGHETGDQVLIEISKRIGNAIRGGDTVARLGGDEFVVLLLGLDRGSECVNTLERLLEAISQPISIKGNVLSLSASIGVSIYPLDNEDVDALLRHADQAMYAAKLSGKNRYYLHDTEQDQRTREHQAIRNHIKQGLLLNQFELYYQPKVDLRSKNLVGAEALIRWRHPDRGLLLPSEFLRQIENTELDIEIGEWVIVSALNQIKQWRLAGLEIEVSINISAHHLESFNFVEKLLQQLAQFPEMPAGSFQIEVLETAALEDVTKVSKIIEACHSVGVGFALDDFGTGYSSLLYLSRLPVDTLKIDQSFIRDMLEDKGDRVIVQGIIALAQAFNLNTVAEGVESFGHYQMLQDMGCGIGQGYGIARPMPAVSLPDWIFKEVIL